jgi:hypothetical protein
VGQMRKNHDTGRKERKNSIRSQCSLIQGRNYHYPQDLREIRVKLTSKEKLPKQDSCHSTVSKENYPRIPKLGLKLDPWA